MLISRELCSFNKGEFFLTQQVVTICKFTEHAVCILQVTFSRNSISRNLKNILEVLIEFIYPFFHRISICRILTAGESKCDFLLKDQSTINFSATTKSEKAVKSASLAPIVLGELVAK